MRNKDTDQLRSPKATTPDTHGASGEQQGIGKKPLLFLSHAGIQTEAALLLASRIEQTPAAREAGLKVWIDDRELGRA
jgi:hypothetical protein